MKKPTEWRNFLREREIFSFIETVHGGRRETKLEDVKEEKALC